MNRQQRSNYWEAWERQRLAVQNKYEASFRRIFKEAVLKARKLIEIGGINYAKSSLNLELLNDGLVNVLSSLYRETSVKWANMVYRSLKIESQKSASFVFNEEWAREAMRFLSLEGIPMISTVTGNLREEILKIIDEAVQDGFENSLSIDDVIRNIIERLKVFGEERSRYWAERISRTETVRGANYGAMQGARKHNFVVRKVWIAANDKRTRPSPGNTAPFSHRALDGQTQDLETPFNNGENIMQPGDPKASPANTINCRCAVAFEPVRDQNGKLIPK